jgi:arsenite-transporting ATPase
MSAPLSELVARATRFLFFTGKGGVGKTSLACATSLALADRGRRILLVSTDPASNLDEVLGVKLGREPRSIPGADSFFALNIDPEEVACAYRAKIVEPMRGILPDAALRSIEEQLSGACTTEIASFDEFARLLGDESATEGYDHVVFDTAPTGHTLRLLALPEAWTGFFETNTSGTSCLGPLAGLDQQKVIYEKALDALADSSRTTLVLVSRASIAPLREAERTHGELAALGIENQSLVLNGVFAASDSADPVAASLELRGMLARGEFQFFLKSLPVFEVPLRAYNLVGLDSLRAIWSEGGLEGDCLPSLPPAPDFESIGELIDDLAASGHGIVMTMGKGGVGKTTIAAALALALADRGYEVVLSTTDPAAHVSEALGGEVEHLTVQRIDPSAETQAYVDEVLATQGAGLSPDSRALLEEDLRSPCTEEIAVFRAFARTVASARDRFVILDTAPTGHTLLLLDATEAYHRELGRQSRESTSSEVRELLPRLRDSEYTRVLLITLPEATPVHEAAALQADLRRAGIEPMAWIINQSFHGLSTRDPLLGERAANEVPYMTEVVESLATRAALLQWQAGEPAGIEALRTLFQTPTNHI